MKRALAFALAFFLLCSGMASAQQVLLVHLPGAPVEAANRIAGAANALAAYLSQEVPDVTLDVQLFRRFADADAYLRGGDGSRVVAVVVEASFLLDAGAGGAFVPTHRLRRGGKGSSPQGCMVIPCFVARLDIESQACFPWMLCLPEVVGPVS